MIFLYHYYYISMVANVSNKRVKPDQKSRWKTISFGAQKSKKLEMIRWIMVFYESFKTSHFSEEHKATAAWPHDEVQIQKKIFPTAKSPTKRLSIGKSAHSYELFNPNHYFSELKNFFRAFIVNDFQKCNIASNKRWPEELFEDAICRTWEM